MESNTDERDNKAPLLGKWSNFYWLLIIVLLALIGLFYGITVYFE